MTKEITRLDWADLFLKEIHAPFGSTKGLHGRWALVAWQAAEGGPIGAKFNPLNTTQRMPGSKSFNHVGVQSYLSLEDGLRATALTIEQTDPDLNYAPILSHLRAGDQAREVLLALKASSWGTGPLALKILHDVKKYWDRDYAHILIPQ